MGDEIRQAGHVVGLDVRLEHRHDRRTGSLCSREVLVDGLDMRATTASMSCVVQLNR